MHKMQGSEMHRGPREAASRLKLGYLNYWLSIKRASAQQAR